MSATVLRGSSGVVDRIEDACAADLEPAELLLAVTEQIERAVRADAVFASATDPETGLSLGAGLVRGMPAEMCDPFWEFEFEVPDFNKFADLMRSEQAVADLHAVTGGRPERSARWRELSPFDGIDAELRAAFKVGQRTWGILQLNRRADGGGFTPAEQNFIATISPLVGDALRRATVTHVCTDSSGRGPGMAVFDAQHRLVSASEEAAGWFSVIHSYNPRRDTELGIAVPFEVLHAVQLARARASAAAPGTPPGPTRTRVRTGCGAWGLVHASCMTEAGGRLGHTAVVIERAKASDVAPLIVEAYALTPRELDVTRALARGLSTGEIAKELFLSRYTVQDHLKRIYEKVGVASRGELVAKMFADHYHDRAEVVHIGAG